MFAHSVEVLEQRAKTHEDVTFVPFAEDLPRCGYPLWQERKDLGPVGRCPERISWEVALDAGITCFYCTEHAAHVIYVRDIADEWEKDHA